MGVAVADVARALGLVVWIVPAWVRTLQAAPTKNGLWVDPPTEGGPMIQNRTSVEDQLMIAELRLYKNKNKNKNKIEIILWAIQNISPLPVIQIEGHRYIFHTFPKLQSP